MGFVGGVAAGAAVGISASHLVETVFSTHLTKIRIYNDTNEELVPYDSWFCSGRFATQDE